MQGLKLGIVATKKLVVFPCFVLIQGNVYRIFHDKIDTTGAKNPKSIFSLIIK